MSARGRRLRLAGAKRAARGRQGVQGGAAPRRSLLSTHPCCPPARIPTRRLKEVNAKCPQQLKAYYECMDYYRWVLGVGGRCGSGWQQQQQQQQEQCGAPASRGPAALPGRLLAKPLC